MLDIGANVGHCTLKLSELVGPAGRVIAFEPVPATFEVLTANSHLSPCANITLINAALADRSGIRRIAVPDWPNGIPNYYRASLKDGDDLCRVLCLAVDDLGLRHPIALIKIDVEGAAAAVVAGAMRLIARDRPILIVEGEAAELLPLLESVGYEAWRCPGSPNVILSAGWTGGPGGLRHAGQPSRQLA